MCYTYVLCHRISNGKSFYILNFVLILMMTCKISTHWLTGWHHPASHPYPFFSLVCYTDEELGIIWYIRALWWIFTLKGCRLFWNYDSMPLISVWWFTEHATIPLDTGHLKSLLKTWCLIFLQNCVCEIA